MSIGRGPAGPLSGLRVVECGDWISAPFCARLLADLGAEVVKVERPQGDLSRQAGGGTAPDGALFAYLNCGKTIVEADLDDPGGRASVERLLADADVFVENLEPADRTRWGLDFATLEAVYPRLVIASLSPFGRSGPWAGHPGTDICAQAAASVPYGLGVKDREPLRIPYDQADYQAALHAAAAILCAVRERHNSGRGQGIDISTAQVMGYLVGGMHRLPAKSGRAWQRQDSVMGRAPMGFFECGDGFVIVALQKRQHRDAFDALMGRPEDAEFFQYLMGWMKDHTRRELLDLALTDDKVVLGIAQHVDEVLTSPQYAHRDLWATADVDGGEIRFPKPAYRFSESPVAISPGWSSAATDLSLLDSDAKGRAAGQSGGSGPRRPALEGVRVLEFGWNWAGPMCGQLLADMGAEVIRIETAGRQDEMRFRDFASWFFCNTNRSTMSTTINVAGEEGAELVRALAARSDIVLDNLAAGVMRRNGLGYDDLRAVKDDIIVLSMSMAGQEGPERGLRGFASIATAYSGLELMIGYEQDEISTGLLSFGLGDATVAIQGAIAALAALEHRTCTGEGQSVDVSQIDAAVATLAEPILEYETTEVVAGPQGNRHSTFSPHGLYPTAGDDRWVGLAVTGAAQWRALAALIGHPEWADDPTLQTSPGRRARAGEIDDAIRAWTSAQDRDAAAEALWAAGVPAAPLLELTERDEHPQFTSRGFTIDHEADGWDPCHVYATPWLLDATPPRMHRPTPLLGEHNDYVWHDLLELDDEEIERLKKAGVLA